MAELKGKTIGACSSEPLLYATKLVYTSQSMVSYTLNRYNAWHPELKQCRKALTDCCFPAKSTNKYFSGKETTHV